MTDSIFFNIGIYLFIMGMSYGFCRLLQAMYDAGTKRGVTLALDLISHATFQIDILVTDNTGVFEIKLKPKQTEKQRSHAKPAI